MNHFLEEIEALESAEDFLDYFDIDFVREVVEVNRLHILQRFHNLLQQSGASEHATCKVLMQQAYDDFVSSDAATEKVFAVYRRAYVDEVHVPLSNLMGVN